MKVIIETKGRYSDRPEVMRFLMRHKRIVEDVMGSGLVRYRPCRLIVLRPYYWRVRPPYCSGQAIYDEWRGRSHYQIALVYEKLIELPDKGLSITIHECSHIVEHQKYGTMRHGKNFHSIYKMLLDGFSSSR